MLAKNYLKSISATAPRYFRRTMYQFRTKDTTILTPPEVPPKIRKAPWDPDYLGLRGIIVNTQTTKTTPECPETEPSKIEFCLILFGYWPTPY